MTSKRVRAIEAMLADEFAPATLIVKDQSHLHAGHEGAKSGGGHFHVTIVSESFRSKSPIERHRMVFAALASMMELDIHALRIQANSPDEV